MGFFSQLMGDLVFLRGVLRALRMTTHIAKNPARIFPNVIEELAARHGDAPALLSPRETFSYRQLFERSNRYSRWARREGICKRRNRLPADAEPAGIHGGLARHHPHRRRHRAAQYQPDRAVARALHRHRVAEACDRGGRIDGPVREHPAAAEDRSEGLDCMAQSASIRVDRPPSTACPARRSRHRSGRALTIEDPALYIYTSGTTGMPKAANINHYRVMLACFGFAGVMGTRKSDRNYVCLPMYHTAGGLCAIGSLLVHGGSVYIRERFSVRDFWDDIVKQRLHHDAIYRRAVPLSRQRAAATRTRPNTSCGSPAATDCVPISGRSSRPAFGFR